MKEEELLACENLDDVKKLVKQVPPLFDSAEPAFVLRVQDLMCQKSYMSKRFTCDGDCPNCILDADLSEFSDWLINQLNKSGE